MKASFAFLIGTPVAAVGLIVGLFGLGGYDLLLYGHHYVETRTAYWKQVLANELPIGSTQPQIEQWAARRSLPIYHATDGKNLEITVQTIPWHQVVCKEWNIIAEIKLENQKAVSEDVVGMGACL